MASNKFWHRVVLLLLCNGFAMLGLAAPETPNHLVTLTWTPAMQPANINAVSWNIYRSTVSAGPYALIASVPAASLSYTDSAVGAGIEYFYAVTCVDSAGVESMYSAAADATIPGGDFIGTFDHGAASTNPGGQASYVLTLTASVGFQGGVTLGASGLPPFTTASFSPAVVAGGSGTSTLTVTTAVATLQGEYLFTITGTSGNLTHWTTLQLLVGTVDFMGTISPTAQSVSTATPPGIYAPLITAAGGGVAHSTNINLTVTPNRSLHIILFNNSKL